MTQASLQQHIKVIVKTRKPFYGRVGMELENAKRYEHHIRQITGRGKVFLSKGHDLISIVFSLLRVADTQS